jgi:hypothetical protein
MNSKLRICTFTLGMLSLVLLAVGCRSAYYAAWEKFGVEKRDLLR